MTMTRLLSAAPTKQHAARSHFGGLIRILVLSAASLGVASCVASKEALVSDAKPTMGPQFTAELFRRFTDGRANELQASTFQWEDGAYVAVSSPVDLRRFVSMPLKGNDSIIQGSDTSRKMFSYWLGRSSLMSRI